MNPECKSKIIKNVDASKATQQGDIPTKIIKDNTDLISCFISVSFNNAVNKGVFPDKLKQADIKPIDKKNQKVKNERPVSILPKFLNVVCMISLMITLVRYSQNVNADFERGLAHSIDY